MSKKSSSVLVVGLSVVLALGIGFLSNLLSGNVKSIYSSLKLPLFAPPGGVFPIVWTILFILMGISAAIVYLSHSKSKRNALRIYFFQLLCNFAWSIFFFRFRALWFSSLWILFLAALIIATITEFVKINHPSAILQIPYLLWVCFASVINIAVALLN